MQTGSERGLSYLMKPRKMRRREASLPGALLGKQDSWKVAIAWHMGYLTSGHFHKPKKKKMPNQFSKNLVAPPFTGFRSLPASSSEYLLIVFPLNAFTCFGLASGRASCT